MTRKNFCTLDELYDRCKAWNDSLADDIVDSGSLAFHSPHGLAYQANQESMANELFKDVVTGQLEERTEFTDHGFAQLAERFKVRADWAADDEKCPPELRKMIFDWKFENYERSNLMIRNRTNGGSKTRAVLSDQYTRYDNLEFVESVISALDHAGLRDTCKVWRPDIGDKLKLYILIDNIQFDADAPPDDAPNGDGNGTGGLKPAIYLGNSEIGTARARAHGGLYRSACTNGMIFGWKQQEGFAYTHRWKSETHMHTLMNEAIATALNMSERAGTAFLESRAQMLEPTKLDGIINKWAKKYGVTMDARKEWRTLCKAQLGRDDRISKFDLVNHATDIAGGQENTDLREDMEIMAGELVFAEFEPALLQRPRR